MKPSEIQAFIRSAQVDVGYREAAKLAFHRDAKRVLRVLAKELGLARGEYDLRGNMGGIAVSGEITLHTDTLYVQFSQGAAFGGTMFLWRTCKGRKDYGIANRWAKWDALLDLPRLAASLKAAVAASAVAQY